MFLPYPALYIPSGPLQPKSESLRFVDRWLLGRRPIEAHELLQEVVDSSTRYLVLDLDKTIHKNRNIGELLGWELNAYRSYGVHYQQLAQHRYQGRKLVFLWHHPLGLLKYFWRGLRLWAFPGLYYLIYGKVLFHFPLTRSWIYRRFGPDPIAVIQEFPRQVLLHEMARYPKSLLRQLTENLWQRFAADQVFEKRHFETLKRRHPQLKIILSSASPEVVLQVAKEKLAVDHIHYTAIEASEQFYLPPTSFLGSLYRFRRPMVFAKPDSMEPNASLNKVQRLAKAYPDFLQPSVVKVGISDTSHGEDFYWSTVFTRLVDVNSPQPFSPIVAEDSPLQDLISCQLMSQSERRRYLYDEASASGIESNAPDEQESFQIVTRSELARLLLPVLQRCQSRYVEYVRGLLALRPVLGRLISQSRSLRLRLSRAVQRYNRASDQRKKSCFVEVSHLVRDEQSLYQKMLCVLKPLSERRRRYLDELYEARNLLAKSIRPKV